MTALDLIATATAEAHAKHGRSFDEGGNEFRLMIMLEELGECSRAAQDLEVARSTNIDQWRGAHMHLLHEVAQLGSLCMRWLEVDGAK